MTDPRDFWGLLGSALLIASGAIAIIPLKKTVPRHLLAAALAGVALLPLWRGLAAAAYLRGIIGDVSAATLMLTTMYLFGGEGAKNNARDWFLGMILISGLMLYPFSLGPFPIDPYQWGYQPWWILAAIALSGLVILHRQPATAYYIAFPVAAFALNLSWSRNLWDYLLDPLLFGYALIHLLHLVFRRSAPSEGRLFRN